jgi:hypothetical protein
MRKMRVIGYFGIILIALLVIFAVVFVYLNKPQVTENRELRVKWQQFLPGISGSRLIQTSDGGFLALGTRATLQEGADSNIFVNQQSILIKTDSSGNMVWQRAFVVEGLQANLYDVIETNDEGFLTVGGIQSIDNGIIKSSKYCAIKLDNNGNELWSQTYPAQLSEIIDGFQSVFETNDENYVLLGTWRYEWDYHGFSHNWFAKIDASGKLLLNTSIPVSGAISISPIDNEEYVVFSEWQATGGGSTFELAKIDSNGNLIWRQRYNQTGAISAYEHCGIMTIDGGFLLGGQLIGIGGWLIKTNSEGNAIWNKTYSGSIQSAIQTLNGDYVIGGGGWLAKLDNNGRIEAQVNFSESAMKDYYSTVKQVLETDNGYVFVGTFDETYQASTQQKFWLVKISLD